MAPVRPFWLSKKANRRRALRIVPHPRPLSRGERGVATEMSSVSTEMRGVSTEMRGDSMEMSSVSAEMRGNLSRNEGNQEDGKGDQTQAAVTAAAFAALPRT